MIIAFYVDGDEGIVGIVIAVIFGVIFALKAIAIIIIIVFVILRLDLFGVQSYYLAMMMRCL